MKNFSSDKNSKEVPLYIGITGHRDLIEKDKSQLFKTVKRFLINKKIQCPNTPIILLTQLAEGADRIAAQAAIESNIAFIAVLPFSKEEYLKDFQEEFSQKEFIEYLNKASEIIEIPINIDSHKSKEIEIDREEQYFQAGLFIANLCHYLIALWDGVDTKKKGGTSHIYNIKRTGYHQEIENKNGLLQQVQTGPIFHIVTPRLSNPHVVEPFDERLIFPLYLGKTDLQAKERDAKMLNSIDNYNRDIVRHVLSVDKSILYKYNLSRANLSSKNNHEILKIDNSFCVADYLSIIFQKRHFLSLKVLIIFVVVAFVFLQLYLEFIHKEWALALYPILMGVGALYFLFAKKQKHQGKYEDYRAFAEALRIQFYLFKTGNFFNISNFYLLRHRAELEWVIYSIKAISFRVNIQKVEEIRDIKYAKENWIKNQLMYFESKTIKHHQKHTLYKKFANMFFIMAIFSACFLFSINSFSAIIYRYYILDNELIHAIIVSITHISLVLSAALHGYNEKMLFAEQSKSYQKMAHLYQLAEYKLNEALIQNNTTLAKRIISELAQEALLENADWILLHRSRPLELPKG